MIMNMNMEFERKLTIPMEVKKMYPLDDNLRQIVEEREKQAQAIFSGKVGQLAISVAVRARYDSKIDKSLRL